MSIEELIGRYPNLEVCRGSLEAAYKTLEECFAGGGKLLIAGNGGSAADSDHIVGELMKGFVKRRPLSEELTFSKPILPNSFASLKRRCRRKLSV